MFGKKKKLFGGYVVNFKGVKETLEEIFGTKPIPPSEMTKRLWNFIKKRKLIFKT